MCTRVYIITEYVAKRWTLKGKRQNNQPPVNLHKNKCIICDSTQNVMQT